ncbi:MAG: hypothetical protein ACR2FY_16980 [Pirellulaceae bacterium]
MIDPLNIPSIADEELLARFIVNSNERRSDGNVTPKLFLPYSRVDLSVNRHRNATEDETWSIGRKVAAQRGKALYGRADIRASSCRISPLDVLPMPILPENPNHAEIVGYPPAKEDQLSLAEKLAAAIEGKWKAPPLEVRGELDQS